MITQCCVCKKVRQDDGSWTSQETEGRMDISHGYCPKCYAQVLKDIEEGKQ